MNLELDIYSSPFHYEHVSRVCVCLIITMFELWDIKKNANVSFKAVNVQVFKFSSNGSIDRLSDGQN